MKKLNIPLIIGLIIVMGVTFLVFFGEYYAPHDARIAEDSVWVEKDNGERQLKRAPFAPDETYLLGTDNAGRDILSVIMAGAKNTFTIVVITTLFRFLLALPIAFLAAFGEKLSKSLIRVFSSTFTAVPSLLICVIILKVRTISNLSLNLSIIAFVFVFTIIGWGRLANTIQEQIKDILNQDFIQGEIAIGKSKLAIATKNVIVHLMPSIIIFIFLEISLVLLLLAQLGVFEIFVGNKQIFGMRPLGPLVNTTFNFFPEWGAMLASTRRSISSSNGTFWMALYPLSAFVISIIGFNLLGQGLNYELNKRNSKFISYINRLWFHLSVKTFINEVKNFKKKRKIVISKITVLTTVFLMILIPILSNVVIADEGVMLHVNELMKDEYQGRLVATSGNIKTGDYIASKLKQYNVEPLFNDSYYSEFKVSARYNIVGSSEVIISDESGNKIDELKYKVNYYIENWSSLESVKGKILTMEDYLAGEFDKTKEYFLLLSYETNQSYIYNEIATAASKYKFIKGVIFPDTKNASFLSTKIELSQKGLVNMLDNIETFTDGIPPIKINVSKNTAIKLFELSGNTMTVNAQINYPEGISGRNIGGLIKGKNDENPIVIISTYDYLGVHDFGTNTSIEDEIIYKGIYDNGTSIAGSLELSKNLGKRTQTPDRSIIFLFVDGAQISGDGFKDFERYGYIQQEPLIIYLNYLGINRWGRAEDSIYNHTPILGNNTKIESEFYRWMRRNSANSNYFIIPDSAIRIGGLEVFRNYNVTATVLQGLKESEKSSHIGMPQSNLEEIDGERLRSNIQFLLESISDIAYGRRWFR